VAPDFTRSVTFNFPTPIVFGAGAINQLPANLSAAGVFRPLIVTDPTVEKLPFVAQIVGSLRAANLTPALFGAIHPNPIKGDVLAGVEAFKAHQADAIVGLGGGAPLDVARAIALKVNHPRDLFDYEDVGDNWKRVTEPIPHFVTVPTTAGTGSEVGRSTVISEDETHRKRILFSPRLMAKAVFADPELTMALPPKVTAATGIDALTHHLEAFLAKGFHPLCEGIALEGIRLISRNLPQAVSQPNLENRGNMLIAALMGAVAFQKGLGVVHSSAHPLSTVIDLHHGLANAIMLPHGMAFNARVGKEPFARIASALGVSDQTADAVVDYLHQLNKTVGLPIRLRDVGVKETDIDRLVSLAVEDVCHQCNPLPVSIDDFRRLYRAAW